MNFLGRMFSNNAELPQGAGIPPALQNIADRNNRARVLNGNGGQAEGTVTIPLSEYQRLTHGAAREIAKDQRIDELARENLVHVIDIAQLRRENEGLAGRAARVERDAVVSTISKVAQVGGAAIVVLVVIGGVAAIACLL